jgi:hypothetical protein
MIAGLAHTGVGVPDCEAAVAYYRDVRADGSDARRAAGLADPGLTHIGLVCDDLDETRKSLEHKGVHFLVDGIADIDGVRTTWFADPWGVVFIFVERGRPERPYFAQFG